MGSKASGKHYTSKGERISSIKTSSKELSNKVENIQSAYWKGQNPWVTIDNPNREETNKRKIRVKANVLWGDPKVREKNRFILGGNS
jgi:hypothetical protein